MCMCVCVCVCKNSQDKSENANIFRKKSFVCRHSGLRTERESGEQGQMKSHDPKDTYSKKGSILSVT